MKALVTIEVPDDGACRGCPYRDFSWCVPFMSKIDDYDSALKQCRDAVQRYKEGVR